MKIYNSAFKEPFNTFCQCLFSLYHILYRYCPGNSISASMDRIANNCLYFNIVIWNIRNRLHYFDTFMPRRQLEAGSRYFR